MLCADKTTNSLTSTMWLCDAENPNNRSEISRSLFDEKTVFYKNGMLYHLKCVIQENKELFYVCEYEPNTGRLDEISKISESIYISTESVYALNDKYVCINNGEKYCLWINDKNEVVDIKITEEHGKLIDCFTNPELTDKIIFVFKDGSSYQYYEVTQKGNLRSLGYVEPDTDNVVVNGDIIYSVSGNEDKEIKVFDIKRR